MANGGSAQQKSASWQRAGAPPDVAVPNAPDTRKVVDEARLRHGSERPVFIASLLLNIALVVAAVALLRSGNAWLHQFPAIEKFTKGLNAAATALILAPFALTLARNQRRETFQANGVRIGPTQFPEVYEDYIAMCERLGMRNVPELYIADGQIKTPSTSDSTWSTQFIVLDTSFLGDQPEERRPVYRFLLAHELGRLRLGHTHWLNELLTAYVIRIPLLRNPMQHTRTYSHDRYSAVLAPDAVRGLVVQATGRHLLAHIDLDGFLRQMRAVRGWRPRILQLTQGSPYLAFRLQALDRAELTMTDVAGTARTPAHIS